MATYAETKAKVEQLASQLNAEEGITANMAENGTVIILNVTGPDQGHNPYYEDDAPLYWVWYWDGAEWHEVWIEELVEPDNETTIEGTLALTWTTFS